MDNWIIGTKLFIVLYCVLKYVSGNMTRGAEVLLLILLYVCINMLFYIVKSESLKRCFLILSLILLLASAYYVNILFLLPAPMNGAELMGRFSENVKLSVVPAALIVVFVSRSFFPEYMLAAVFSLCMFILSRKAYSRVSMLSGEVDRLRERNDALYKRLDVSTDYENQLRYLTQMEERNSLAQKIHDKVGHSIAGSLIQLEAASVIIGSDTAKARDIIGNVIQVLKEGMENIRSTLRNIKPAAEQLGINRLKAVLDKFTCNSSIKAFLSYNGDLSPVSHLQWKIVMDNLKEALTNTLKYSSATTVKVDLAVLNKLIRVEVRDNGVGAFSPNKGLGLRGMEERTESAGGKLIIDGSKGFSIIMLLPVSEVSDEDKSADSR